MVWRKYTVFVLFLLLSGVYVIFSDICVGLPWNTIIINWRFTMFSPIERIITVIWILLLFIPDLIKHLRRKQGHTSASSSSPNTHSKNNGDQESSFNPKSGPSS